MSSNEPKKCIFVVEDSKDIRDLIQLFYESEGYGVEFAIDGRDALEKLAKRTELPGVILLDLMMPGMDGFQFREVQKQDPRIASIPVLVMSADAAVDAKAKQVGANGFLRKPVSVDTFIAVAEKYCNSNVGKVDVS